MTAVDQQRLDVDATPRTRVLALDLSLTATGICTPDGDHSAYSPHSRGDTRLLEISDTILELVNSTTRPHLVVIEDLPPAARNKAAASLGMLHGAIRLTLIREGLRYMVINPSQVKTYATGRGNAPKPDLRMELFKRTGLDVPDDNAVDARWLWYLAHDLRGRPWFPLPQTHRRALNKLAMPEGLARAV